MGLPLPPNTTMDIYRSANAPPAAPYVAAVACNLQPTWLDARSHVSVVSTSPTDRWTHVALVLSTTDIRDSYNASNVGSNQDTIYVPNKSGTPFQVRFVERVFRGQAA